MADIRINISEDGKIEVLNPFSNISVSVHKDGGLPIEVKTIHPPEDMHWCVIQHFWTLNELLALYDGRADPDSIYFEPEKRDQYLSRLDYPTKRRLAERFYFSEYNVPDETKTLAAFEDAIEQLRLKSAFEWIKYEGEQFGFPIGARVRTTHDRFIPRGFLSSMEVPHIPVPKGSTGTVEILDPGTEPSIGVRIDGLDRIAYFWGDMLSHIMEDEEE